MAFVFQHLRVHSFPIGNHGITIWDYDGGEDYPSELTKPGYFQSTDLKPRDRIMAVCHDGGVHLDLVVVSVKPVAVGVMARYPDGLTPGRRAA